MGVSNAHADPPMVSVYLVPLANEVAPDALGVAAQDTPSAKEAYAISVATPLELPTNTLPLAKASLEPEIVLLQLGAVFAPPASRICPEVPPLVGA